ncbi:PREDICTED: phosphatidylinositol N-acetylglucosaminyltransferase subunit Y-like [Propithecus coquereli]|uniref:phosphatidylinositol N-acetylglucosaminyltransferase subunit Y-like n=1 Tax=Propithecus coquereli TaxID=379532 RepID=UPI00063F2249|nr:PREDICTED: phosphatidylinositol N-acetylglucosaminyltransferase subunit Y-like [Propithecus coquereli]
MFLSLPMSTVLIPFVSLAGLFYLASVEEKFSQGCSNTTSLSFYTPLLPITVPVYVFFHLWTQMGVKRFRHN